MKKSLIIGIIIGVIMVGAIILIYVNSQKSKLSDESIGKRQQGVQRNSLGDLCSNEKECREFCLNNKGRCEEYCKGNENELCQIIFPAETFEQTTSKTKPIEDKPPVLKNLGFNIEPWNKQTNLAAELIFTKKLLYDDGYISNDKVFIEFGHSDKYEPESLWIEYWFFVPLGTKIRAPTDGIVVSVGFFNHTQDFGIGIARELGSSWRVDFEHVINVAVKEGDVVKAGDIIAEAAPRKTFNYEIAMTELAVWTSGKNIIKFCPFSFLQDSLKPIYEQKLNQLASDWENFIGKGVYKQENWVAPGCLFYNITEN